MAEKRRLDIILGARDKAKPVLARVQASIGKFAKRAAIAGAAGGAAIAAGLAVMVRRELAAIDTTAKLSSQIDIATEDLIGFQKAADETGVGAAKMNSLLSVMVKRLGEADQGFGSAVRGLEILGLNANEVAQLDTASQFKLIADRVNGLTNATERAAAISAIFSRSGLELANTMRLGSEGLDAVTARTKELGTSFSNLDASKAELAIDAIGNAKDSIKGLQTQLTIQLAPVIEYAADRFTAFATSGSSVSEKVAAGLRTVAGVINAVGRGVDGFRALWQGVKVAAFGVFEFISLGVLSAIELLNRAISLANKVPGVDIGTVDTTLASSIVDEMTAGRRAALDEIASIADSGPLIDVEATILGITEKTEEAIRKKSDTEHEFGTAADRANLAVSDQLLTMREQLETLGMTNNQLAIRELREKGASEAQLEEFRAIQNQIDARKSEIDLVEEGVRLAQSRADAEGDARRQIEALNAALDAGRIGQEQYRLAAEGITAEYAKQGEAAQAIASLSRASGATVRFLTGIAGGGSESSRRAETIRYQRSQATDVAKIRDMFADLLRTFQTAPAANMVEIGGLS